MLGHLQVGAPSRASAWHPSVCEGSCYRGCSGATWGNEAHVWDLAWGAAPAARTNISQPNGKENSVAAHSQEGAEAGDQAKNA
mmetsp:Transcript_112647/g.313312  ORF Transcript_112647/g.313312 Transcript_112647/m.313312 type:complete len:83 (+) Transcript_112647:213-461(+)